ncbi:MAG: hypothetical protein N2049_06980 [Anaerolineales bacterium]|nr:hypothetical protein [Anaerolineales bacterium]
MFAEQNAERNGTKPNETKQIFQESTMTDMRFNPYQVRRAGLRSTVEAKILHYLAQGPADRKSLARLFDLRLAERLERLGLIVYRDGQVQITNRGLETLKQCMGEGRGQGVA